ncbi:MULTISPECIES: hydroxyphenylacetyl-CoA thioesterase PaaI [Rhodobacterales]|nr:MULTISPECIES: hydroxyphenylacetyl-CoA thioesterase PaaI [Phaeobacter]MDF1773101.1 hydroxyphenylacetyl-CoA thioesterase PaaI [Pseudophaeobacter sp. bin_em_oilr2.035]MEE2633698.1 hydroxyphenylacetyl-CoA thioesterase PaaI [Pseudomonadota bacterium]MDE4060543.1 hydroxyphenylacetyl-CoA thioesterase PaaI [Phaeobacter gallaeciensis]MDE4097145.1 hydroxyphenylacetyl-CoA thioesterase PaaI [Phaeobacter gallaeciensis]MDE4105562.1 hydroxyphenylacetyl-CoA thioesterase PaaI [Phaeobacter gallaeciensis]
MTPKERAEKSSAAMWSSDNASKWAGMEIAEVDAGRAVLQLTVEAHHCNGHGICHGGVTFMLADSAFAFACNSRNQATVAQSNSITYTAPGRLGDRLTADAREVSLTGRSGIYDVTVKNQDDLVIAEFRGLSRAIKGHLFEE